MSAGAPEADLLSHRGLLPSAAEIAEAIVQTSESRNLRTTTPGAELVAAGRTVQHICARRLHVRVGVEPSTKELLSAPAQSTWSQPLAALAIGGDA